MLVRSLALAAAAAVSALAVPTAHPLLHRRGYTTEDGIEHTVIVDKSTNTTVDYVKNSGVCETTPGVNQYSGYLDVGTGLHMFFWFFESRNSPKTAPFVTWFNGGPGCSSLIGLFQENGPCQFYNGSKTPSINKYSFNEYANMLYVDQPIGTGFSYNSTNVPYVNSTVGAAPYVWNLFQAFFKQFPEYDSREFGIFTESYGGHYGPEFATYIEDQNAQIAAGKISGEAIDLIALGVNNGWYHPSIHYQAYIDFAYSNKYNKLINESQRDSFNEIMKTQCLPGLQQCTSLSSNAQSGICANADNTCANVIEGPIGSIGNYDFDDVREPSNDPYPPTEFVNYLNDPEIKKRIGAVGTYGECSDTANSFYDFGDDGRSTLHIMNLLVNPQGAPNNLTILMWAGDADMNCNYIGNYGVAKRVAPPGFVGRALTNYTVNGKVGGLFKTQDKFSWLQVFDAGHEVPYYQPELSLQVFKQTMMRQAITST